MTEPIRPDQVAAAKARRLPNFVLDAINALLVIRSSTGDAIRLTKGEIVNEILHLAPKGTKRDGLVFANRRTCIDPDQWEVIRDDDGYRQLEPKEEPLPGDVVLYLDNHGLSHVGVITEVEPILKSADWCIEVISQWGSDGEFIHEMSDVPAMLGIPREIWTERDAL